MKQGNSLRTDLILIAVSGLGGFLLSLTGMSIGWMIGTLMTAAFIALRRPSLFQRKGKNTLRIHSRWLLLGQFILGIELGQKMNMKVLHIFAENWLPVSFMLVFSILLAMLSGFVLWKLSKTDMLTSFVGTAPGGLSAMPGIAQEVGANTAVVSLVQTIRVLMVVLTIPFTVFYLNTKSQSDVVVAQGSAFSSGVFTISYISWTAAIILGAWLMSRLAVRLHFPAPWLIGSMLGVAALQVGAGALTGHDLIPYWPAQANIASQVFLGATIGSKMNKQMFVGLKNTLIVAVVSSAGLIAATVLSSIAIAEITGISVITAILAFSPGGIAEMATTAVTLHEDSTFVVAVQVVRIILVIAMLPPFFRFLHHVWAKRQTDYKAAK
ncbi:membrane protein [Bacillus pumilus]|uniref:AbrB family transcriptional regulator n=1 Tax=Bacillus altitudinis TaxID=293387 RepID=UPI0005A0716C|nr:AbrB family transcriptional regulator [Bacillus altitudinis]AMM88401.1 membrane protein [Bacillus pumilus]MCI9886328.1 AbrB family transcriptional regulator [Bacillus altitudinis]MCY7449792.1 AbrB family transcriptional regulator [Bacillus altitudinis]MCY7631443.1 AbrB family transcriptional regulator [Bacillus altitudinis]NEU53604.1 AbrB family transcriptional regulator [Bacillus altitudinis]